MAALGVLQDASSGDLKVSVRHMGVDLRIKICSRTRNFGVISK